jgi:hypothetical protein
MNSSESVTMASDKAKWRIPNFPLSAPARTASLYVISAALGGAGWSGVSSLNYFALLFPFVYLQSRRRLDSLCAVFLRIPVDVGRRFHWMWAPDSV